MDVEEAREFIRSHNQAVLATWRRDGGVQMSPVLIGIDGKGRGIVSTWESSAKVRNLRRDPRVAACVLPDRFYGDRRVQIDGTAQIVSLPEAMEPLVDYYRRLAGEHPDWEDYREAMQRDGRCLLRITIERTLG